MFRKLLSILFKRYRGIFSKAALVLFQKIIERPFVGLGREA